MMVATQDVALLRLALAVNRLCAEQRLCRQTSSGLTVRCDLHAWLYQGHHERLFALDVARRKREEQCR